MFKFNKNQFLVYSIIISLTVIATLLVVIIISYILLNTGTFDYPYLMCEMIEYFCHSEIILTS